MAGSGLTLSRVARRFGKMGADGALHILHGLEMPVVEVNDVILHGDETKPVLVGNDDADGNALIFDDLLLHNELLPAGHCRLVYNIAL